MIHPDWFNTYDEQEKTETLDVDPNEIVADWPEFLAKQGISGRMLRENTNTDGDLVREYASASGYCKITLVYAKNQALIECKDKTIAGTIVGFHRIRGFSGPLPYQLYAILLDLTGISLIIFAITGSILWLNLLNREIYAWIILVIGFLYVGAVMAYLMMV